MSHHKAGKPRQCIWCGDVRAQTARELKDHADRCKDVVDIKANFPDILLRHEAKYRG